MAKLTLDTVPSGYLTATKYNSNNDLIEAALENTLSRDGTTPNNMEAELDMDSHKITNLGAPEAANDAARWVDVTDAVSLTGTAVPALTGNSQKYLGTDGTSLGWKNFYDQTSRELAAGVTPSNYAYPEFNFLRYGGVGDGSTDNATALTNAVAVAAVSGGTLYFPPGTYYFSAFPSLNSRQGIIFQGVVPANSGMLRGASLQYTGTASPVISASAAQGIEFRDLQFRQNNAGFTGTLMKFGGVSAFCAVRNCLFDSSSACTHLDLDQTEIFVADRCQFTKGNPSVKGQASGGGSWSNIITFRDCEWTNSSSTPVVWGGEKWTFDGCNFEGLTGGAAGAFDYGSPSSKSLTFRDCGFYDVTLAGGTWIAAKSAGLVVEGCRFGGFATATVALNIVTCTGVSIRGNSFDTFSVAISFGDANCAGASIKNNYFVTVTNAIGNSANCPYDLEFSPNYPEIVLNRQFTATLTGMTGATTGNVRVAVNGKLVTLEATASITGTSNAVAMTMTGLPAALYPANSVYVPATALMDNAALVSGIAQVQSGGTIVFGNGGANYSANGFTGSGTKGLGAGFSLSYMRS